MKDFSSFAAAFMVVVALVNALPHVAPRQSSTDRLVFSHFMIGITSDRTSAADYDADMQRAKAYGIDAFALNIGVDPYTDTQLGYAYQSAANNDMKVFISFDFNWWNTGEATAIGQKIAQYASHPAQLMVDGAAFVSSFAGDGLDVPTMRSAAGMPIFFAPNFHPSMGTNISQVDGLLNWLGWPNNGNNKAPTPGANVTVEEGDQEYIQALAGKAYIAPASAWFSTHFGPEVSYSKNWVFPSDLLWFNRWNELLTLGSRFIEIVTWNDYGESHYVGPLSSPHTDDGSSRWVNDMPHDGWLDMAKPFISAFHDGATSVDSYIDGDQIVYWYRPQPRLMDCDATDNCMVPANNGSGNYFEGRPNGWEDMQDSVFVISLLQSPGTVQATSGPNTQSFDAPAGASAFQVAMGFGPQSFALTRNGQTVLSGTSLKDIIDGCVCGIYNFNAYVGSLPAGFSDPLGTTALQAFEEGLKVTTCQPTPSLGMTSTTPPETIPSGTIYTSPPGTTTTTSVPPPPITTTTTTTSAPPPPPTSTAGSVCTAGNGLDNYMGLCSFCCSYGYCPAPCTCTAYSTAAPSPPPEASPPVQGVPLPGEDSTYVGLCSYACAHGYCPDTACTTAGASPPATTTPAPSTTTTTTAPASQATVCTAGYGLNNYIGLCSFCCSYGYCPPGPCTCTAWSTSAPAPPAEASPPVQGVPLAGEDDSYLGLCSFACAHGYCPDTACTTTNATTSATPAQATVCTSGYGLNNYMGLCSFSCSYGYCPPGPCTCTAWSTSAPAAPPEASPVVEGVPLPGEDDSYLGLCSFACAHGYCPSTACTTAMSGGPVKMVSTSSSAVASATVASGGCNAGNSPVEKVVVEAVVVIN